MTADSVCSVVPAVQSTGLGVPLFYQRTATRINLNPTHGKSAVTMQKRPTFTPHQEGSKDAAEIAHMMDVSPSGEIGEKFQVHLVADRRNFVGR